MHIEYLSNEDPEIICSFREGQDRLDHLKTFQANGGKLNTIWVSEYQNQAMSFPPEPPYYGIDHLLGWTISENDLDSVRWLLEQGVSVDFRQDIKTLALSRLTGTFFEPLTYCLSKLGDAYSQDDESLIRIQQDILILLLQYGAKLHQPDLGDADFPLTHLAHHSFSSFGSSSDEVDHIFSTTTTPRWDLRVAEFLYEVLDLVSPYQSQPWKELLILNQDHPDQAYPWTGLCNEENLMQMLRSIAEQHDLKSSSPVPTQRARIRL